MLEKGMESQDQIINRVAGSALVTFDLEEYYQPGERVLLDIKFWLFQELIVKEKEFRDFVRNHDWSRYQDKFLAITCSADAIVPHWAYMLVTIAAQPFAKHLVLGTLEELETDLFRRALATVEWSRFKGAKVVVKGCSKVSVPTAVYVDAARELKPLVASLMFGEPCSTVPLYKKPKG